MNYPTDGIEPNNMLHLPNYFQRVETSNHIARMVPFRDRVGNLFIGMNVQKKVQKYAEKYVPILGLQDIRIGLIRGSFRDSTYKEIRKGFMIFGRANNDPIVGIQAVFYSPKLALKDRTILEGRYYNILEMTILHELLHIRYPEKDEESIQQLTLEIYEAEATNVPIVSRKKQESISRSNLVRQ